MIFLIIFVLKPHIEIGRLQRAHSESGFEVTKTSLPPIKIACEVLLKRLTTFLHDFSAVSKPKIQKDLPF